MKILFHSINNFSLKDRRKHRVWLIQLAQKEHKAIDTINYIFCDDQYLLRINEKHLNHSTLTDIITFDYCTGDVLSGDIFISIERVKENAKIYNVLFREEIKRIMAHGILHLCGYHDKKPNDKAIMTKKEDYYLSLYFQNFR